MNWLLLIIVGIFALTCLVDKMTDFIKQLKSKDSAKLKHGFEAKLSVVPIDEKSEDADKHPHK